MLLVAGICLSLCACLLTALAFLATGCTKLASQSTFTDSCQIVERTITKSQNSFSGAVEVDLCIISSHTHTHTLHTHCRPFLRHGKRVSNNSTRRRNSCLVRRLRAAAVGRDATRVRRCTRRRRAAAAAVQPRHCCSTWTAIEAAIRRAATGTWRSHCRSTCCNSSRRR